MQNGSQITYLADTNMSKIISCHNIFANMKQGVLILDKDGHILFINKPALQLFSVTSMNEFEQKQYEFGFYSMDKRSPLIHKDFGIQEILNGKDSFELECYIQNSDSHEGKFIAIESQPIKDDNDNVVAIFSMFRDFTKTHKEQLELIKVKLEQERDKLNFQTADLEKSRKTLEDRNIQLEKSNAELERFAYVTSHDLKAPLRGIKDLVEYIIEDIDSNIPNKENLGDVFKNLKRIDKQVMRMNGLIVGILNYARVNQHDLKLSIFNTAEQLMQIATDFEFSCLSLELPPDLPTFETDAIRLQQVFSNLIGNAVKYHHDISTLKINIKYKETNKMFLFSVIDNGPGIDKRYHQKIFELFQTLQSRDIIESTGIGLSIVKKIVELHGGEISIQSEPGQGCDFTFSWPKKIWRSAQEKMIANLLGKT